MRLGGEFFHPGEGEKPKWTAQMAFLKLVEKCAPEVLQVLDENVRPDYKRAFTGRDDPDELLGPLRTIRWSVICDETILSQHPTIHPLVHSLRTWSAHFHLDADWVRDAALCTLFDWERGGWDPITWGYLSRVGRTLLTDKETLFEFSHRGWEVTFQSRADIASEIRGQFEDRLSAYLNRLEQVALERGFKPSPEWRSGRDKESPMRHLEWLVRWQVQTWAKSQIAQTYNVTETAVRDGLKKTAAYVGLELRKAKPGRPTGP